uniref:SBNO alpha/beta domain-containing protein n=1 Tax=Phlebotomus papatasi TaxID=29031 RepID=A0A1B0D8D4_PHLPP
MLHWENRWADLASEKEGFYLSHQTRNGKQTAILVCFVETAGVKKKKDEKKKKDILCQIYRPNTGLQFRQESLAEIEKKYKKASSEEAEQHWMQQYDASVNTCSHAYWRGNCRNVSMGQDCEVGLRRRTYTVLAGSVLTVWSRVEHVLTSRSGANNKMQVIRMKTKEGQKIGVNTAQRRPLT